MHTERFLLDTNVVSSLGHPRSAPAIRQFIAAQPLNSLFVSALTVGELRRGVTLLQSRDPARASAISAWTDAVLSEYAPRPLPVDLGIASLWGRLSAFRTRPVIDTLLAATALTHNLTLVTRNTRDVADTGVKLLNPWLP